MQIYRPPDCVRSYDHASYRILQRALVFFWCIGRLWGSNSYTKIISDLIDAQSIVTVSMVLFIIWMYAILTGNFRLLCQCLYDYNGPQHMTVYHKLWLFCTINNRHYVKKGLLLFTALRFYLNQYRIFIDKIRWQRFDSIRNEVLRKNKYHGH